MICFTYVNWYSVTYTPQPAVKRSPNVVVSLVVLLDNKLVRRIMITKYDKY